MKVLEALIAARKKIENPANWTQRCEARNSSGTPTHYYSKNACAYCAGGALASVGAPYLTSAYDFMEKLIGQSVPGFNDSHTHAEVLAMFDCAISEAESAAE